MGNTGRGLFVTGTDTGVGKTFVTAALARLLRRQGRPVAVCKPVATGAARPDGSLLSEDTRLLAEAAGRPPGRVTRWAFAEPLAPPVASRRQGVPLMLDAVAGFVREQVPPEGILLVEGVGGLLCPLTDTESVADLAAALSLPLLVVARRSLGTLNHTLLTLEAARSRGLPLAGVVVNEVTPPEGLAEETNVEELWRLGVPVLAVVAHRRECPDAADAPELAAVDWWRLGLAGRPADNGPPN